MYRPQRNPTPVGTVVEHEGKLAVLVAHTGDCHYRLCYEDGSFAYAYDSQFRAVRPAKRESEPERIAREQALAQATFAALREDR